LDAAPQYPSFPAPDVRVCWQASEPGTCYDVNHAEQPHECIKSIFTGRATSESIFDLGEYNLRKQIFASIEPCSQLSPLAFPVILTPFALARGKAASKMTIGHGGVGLAQHAFEALEQMRDFSIERPERRPRRLRRQRAHKDLIPSIDRGLASLVGSYGPKQGTGGPLISEPLFAAPKKLVVRELECRRQVIFAHRSSFSGSQWIERTTDTNLRWPFRRPEPIRPRSVAECHQRSPKILERDRFAVSSGHANWKIKADKHRTRFPSTLFKALKQVSGIEHRFRRGRDELICLSNRDGHPPFL
jgi:hypothetical protein